MHLSIYISLLQRRDVEFVEFLFDCPFLISKHRFMDSFFAHVFVEIFRVGKEVWNSHAVEQLFLEDLELQGPC